MVCDRRSFRLGGRAWRVMTWPLSGHVALALATGLGCGIAASHYPDVIAPSSAAIISTLALYPVMVAAWWRLNSLGGAGDDRLAEADRGNCQRRDSRRMIADGNTTLLASTGRLLTAYGRGRSPQRELSSAVTRARSRRNSSMRARIAGKSSAARGRVTVPPGVLPRFSRDRLENYG